MLFIEYSINQLTAKLWPSNNSNQVDLNLSKLENERYKLVLYLL